MKEDIVVVEEEWQAAVKRRSDAKNVNGRVVFEGREDRTKGPWSPVVGC